MKLAIPVDEKTMATNVCVSFGRAPYFLIYNTVNKEGTFIDNSAAASTGGAGVKAAQIIVDHKVDVLLVPRCGENAAEVFKAADIKLFKTTTLWAQENIDAYMTGKLPALDEIHAGFHGHGDH